MISYIQGIIEQKHEIFKGNYKEMIAAYKRERETTRGYNGRQLLELIQNCEDEKATEVLIHLDEQQRLLRISNNGSPFSKEGYDSLCIDSLSAKRNKKRFIGNKGLGFRAILNWAEEVSIFSNDIRLSYSEEHAQEVYLSLVPENLRQAIQSEFEFPPSVTPIPTLCCPRITVCKGPSGHMTTTIEIKYCEKFQDDIIDQINEIQDQTLLFLRHIECIRFEGIPDKKDIVCKKDYKSNHEFGPSEKVSFGTDDWDIFMDEGTVPAADNDDSDMMGGDSFQIKIAIPLGREIKSSKIYAFFPTQINIDFPFLLHATFDLDSNRNHINRSNKNSFLIDKIIELIARIALYKTKGSVGWEAYDLLQYEDKNGDLDRLGFYDKLDRKISSLKIYPCLDETYRQLQDVQFISDFFSDNIGKDSLNDLFPAMLKAGAGERGIERTRPHADLTEKIGLLSRRLTTVSQRAHWIYLLDTTFPGEPFELLTEDKGAIIPIGTEVFTPATNGEIDIPEYCHLTLLNKELYQYLLQKFDVKSDRKSRDLSHILKESYNLTSYEPQPLAQKIISQTNELLKQDREGKMALVTRAVKALYHNYTLSPESPAPQTILSLPNQQGLFVPANELILSSDYPSGKLTAQIFKQVYTPADYLSDRADLELDALDPDDTERFFIWLGVNPFAIVEQITTTTYREPYTSFLRSNIPYNTGISVELSVIKHFDRILKIIPLEHLIAWIHHDKWLYKQIDNKTHSDKLRYYYYNLKSADCESFIKYQINQSHRIDSLILEDRYQWANHYQIDYRHAIFHHNQISKDNVNLILMRLGAKSTLSELPEEQVRTILCSLPQQYPNGAKTQIIYQDILRYYQTKDKTIDYEVRLFASNGTELGVYGQSDIYFSDRIQLPKKLKSYFPVFNFPLRSSGADAIRIYGINDLRSLSPAILRQTDHQILQQSFDHFFGSINPLILTVRLNGIQTTEQRQHEIMTLKSLRIKLCTELQYKIQAHVEELDNYEYLNVDTTYYIKINETDTLKSLLNRMAFCQTIAEIIANTFDVAKSKPEFLQLLKEDIEDTREWVCREYGSDLMDDANKALKKSDPRSEFIRTIGQLKRIPQEKLMEFPASIGIDLNEYELNFENLSVESNKSPLQKLFSKFEITIEEFNEVSDSALNFKPQLTAEVRNYFKSGMNAVKCAIWQKYAESHPAQLLDKINEVASGMEKFINDNISDHVFEIDKAALFSQYIRLSGLTLDNMDWTEIEGRQIDRISDFTIEEQQIINSDKELKSLLYYSENTEVVRQKINDIRNSNNKKLQEFSQPPIRETEIQIIPGIAPKSRPSSHPDRVCKPRPVWFPSYDQDRFHKQIGNNSETAVYRYMLKHPDRFQFIEWTARESENLHYDLSYSPDQGQTFKYVEVKTYSGEYFELTDSELEFGRKHQKDYEVWLVSNEKIIIITDLFDNYEFYPCRYRVFVATEG